VTAEFPVEIDTGPFGGDGSEGRKDRIYMQLQIDAFDVERFPRALTVGGFPAIKSPHRTMAMRGGGRSGANSMHDL